MNILPLLVVLLPYLFISNTIMGQCDLPTNNSGKYEYVKVVTISNGKSQEQLYNSAIIALSDLFNTSSDVIQAQDKESGYIVGTFSVSADYSMGYYISTYYLGIKLNFKENKYRIKVNYKSHKTRGTKSAYVCSCPNDIAEVSCGIGNCVTKKLWRKHGCWIHSEVVRLSGLLEKKINENTSEDSNW